MVMIRARVMVRVRVRDRARIRDKVRDSVRVILLPCEKLFIQRVRRFGIFVRQHVAVLTWGILQVGSGSSDRGHSA